MPPDPQDQQQGGGVDGHGNRFDDRGAIAPELTGVDAAVALLLAQDGITNGAIYALLALARQMCQDPWPRGRTTK